MKTKILRIVLALFGVLEILGGISAVLLPLINPTDNNAADHNFQETGAGLLFMGIVTLWYARRYIRLSPLIYFKIIFFLLFALLHWFEYLQGNRTILSPLINSAPLLILILMVMFENPQIAKSNKGELT